MLARPDRTIVVALLGAVLTAATHAQTQRAPTPPADRSGADSTPNLDVEVLPNRVLPVDPVLLRQGRAVAGRSELFVDWEGNRYQFADADSRRVFLADPAGFAARDGGACGRMGPLGGLGDARLYTIQENLLYFFASEDCLKRFKENPRRYMEAYDVMPTASAVDQAAGMAAFDRWVAWAGGKDAVRAAERYSQRSIRRIQSGKETWEIEDVLEIDDPKNIRRTKTWSKVGGSPTDRSSTRLETTPKEAAVSGSNGIVVQLTATRREAFERAVNRLPYCILRARFRPEAGFMAFKSGEGRLGQHNCDFVQTWFEGNRTALAIDKATGRLVQIGYVGREESMDAAVMSLYRDVLAEGGPEVLRLPTRVAVYPEGSADATIEPDVAILIERARPAVPPPAPAPAPPAAPPPPGR
jgi:YHS domain-containing protein